MTPNIRPSHLVNCQKAVSRHLCYQARLVIPTVEG